jgi:hypothetical protein
MAGGMGARRIGTVIGPEVGLLTEIVGGARVQVREAGHSSDGLDWADLVEATLWPLVSAGQPELARAAADQWASSVIHGGGAGAAPGAGAGAAAGGRSTCE